MPQAFRCGMSAVRLAVCTQSVCHRHTCTKQQNALLVGLLKGFQWWTRLAVRPDFYTQSVCQECRCTKRQSTIPAHPAEKLHCWNCGCAGVLQFSSPPAREGITLEWQQPLLGLLTGCVGAGAALEGCPANTGELDRVGLQRNMVPGTWCQQERRRMFTLILLSVQLSSLRDRKINGNPWHFCFWISLLKIPAHSAHVLRLVNNSSSYISQVLLKLLHLCFFSPGIFTMLIL